MKISTKIRIVLLIIFLLFLISNIFTVLATTNIKEKELTYKEIENGINLVSGFNIGTKVSDIVNESFLEEPQNTEIKVFDSQNVEITDNLDALIATNYTITLNQTSQDMDYNTEKNCKVIIYGDVNGDGSVNAVDALAIVKNKLNTKVITSEINLEAGRVTNNTRKTASIPNAVDALAIVKYKLYPEEYPIDQKLILEDTPNEPDDNTYLTPLELHGQLSLNGTNIVDKNGDKFQLKGVSTHGIAWFPQYVNQEAFEYMRDEWGINVVRLAMYSDPGANYTREKWALVENGVNYATNAGLYVIIDWHILSDGNPNTYKAEAIEFFKTMATKYKDNNNVLYEICNEPNGNGITWNEVVKPYAEEVISEIRKIDNDAIIICGTPTWSQDVDIVSQHPITNYDNIVYSLHFYAATHKENLRTKLTTALNNGLPIFVSEFGICDASGNGSIDVEEANTWMSLLNKNNISFICWNLSNKNETSAILSSSTTKVTEWTEEELSQTGRWLVGKFKSAEK